MSRARAFHRIALALWIGAALSACSVGTEDSAERIPAEQIPFQLGGEVSTIVPNVDTTEVPDDSVRVFLVRDDRLAVVDRDAVAPDPRGVLSLLAAGPTEAEVAAGLRSALVPDLAAIVEPATADTLNGAEESSVLTVDLASAFIELAPTEQLLALAQITFSVTQLPAISEVRFLVAGQAASVPRGDGSSTDRPVTPADYAEFAPG